MFTGEAFQAAVEALDQVEWVGPEPTDAVDRATEVTLQAFFAAQDREALAQVIEPLLWYGFASMDEKARFIIDALLGPESKTECDHEWVSARNEVVKSGEMCAKMCGAIRA